MSAFAQNKAKNSEKLTDEWNDIEIFEQNRIYPRSNVVSYSNENDIEKWNYSKSPYCVSLNGNWKINVSDNTNTSPNPEQKGFNTNGWNSVKVPMPMVGQDGKQLKLPQIKAPHSIPSNGNVVATYYKEFDAPKSWGDHHAYLKIQARSAYYIWVNQEYVGYAEDSRTMSEFDITKHLKIGKTNNVIVRVVGASTGSLLEMYQDRSYLGIVGDVSIMLKPYANVQDFSVVADYNAQSKEGAFKLTANIMNPAKKGQYYVETVIWNPQGKELEKMGKWMVFDKKSEVSITLERDFASIKPWTAETPNLYTVVVRLRDEKMQLVETVGTRFGFRRVEVSDGQLKVNGTPVVLRGMVYTAYDINNHGLLSEEKMKSDLQLMKQHNVNAIRTAIYSPANERLYELCDEYGLYVICDANIQPFSSQTKAVATDKDYNNHFVVRVQNMYETLKNHASIICWSLGPGRDNGVCMENAYRALKQKDKLRPVLFTGAEYSENTDIIASTNLNADDLKVFAVKKQTRPMVLFGFGSADGNNFGGMESIWEMVRKYNNLQGGFAHMWMTTNRYIPAQNKDITKPGFITASAVQVPYLGELKNVYRPFDVKLVALVPDHGEFNITNYLNFQALKDYILEYNIYSNLKPRIIEGEVNVDLKAGESKNFKLKVPKMTLYSGEELFIRFTIRQRTTTNAVPKGTELGVFEFPLPMIEVRREPLPEYGREELFTNQESAIDGDATKQGRLHVYNNNVDFWFDLDRAEMISLSVEDNEVLAGAPCLNFWRPATDNDKVDRNALRQWSNMDPEKMDRTVVATNYRRIDKYTVGIDAMVRYSDKSGNLLFDVKQSYAVLYTGDVLIDNDIVASEWVKTIPKVGYQFKLDNSLDSVHWLGLDKETYCDRKQSGVMGNNHDAADNLFFAYDRPQAAGNRADVHWVAVANRKVGLFVDMIDKNFNFSIYPYTDKQISNAADCYELKRQSFRTFNVDFKQSGVGSATAGVELADDAVITEKVFSFRLHLHAYACSEAEPQDFRRVQYPKIESSVLPMPVISKNKERFDGPMTISIASSTPQSTIRYTLDGSTPNENSPLYKNPFVINKSTIVHAKAFKKGSTASFTAAQRYNFDYITSANFAFKPNTPYNYDMETSLFDGETGDITDLSRSWLGFSGNDLNVTFTLSKSIELQNVVMHFAHVPEAWAFAPTAVMVYVSADGENFSEAINAKIKYDPAAIEMNTPQKQIISIEVNQPNVKYVKLVARNLGKIPVWHKAKGLRPWILVDEVELNEVIH